MIIKVMLGNLFVGALSDEGGKIAFQYDANWVKDGYSISPLKLPLSSRVYSFPELGRKEAFLGLPGIFADSLPDKFGNTIINAYMKKKGITSPTQLQKLAYIGKNGMGALSYEPSGNKKEISLPLELRKLVDSAKKVMSGKLNGDIDEIMGVGSSAGGARAKAVIAWNRKTNEIRPGNMDAPPGFEHWIIKFDGAEENSQKEWTKCENAYFKMAKDAGIKVPEFSTIKDTSGNTHFLIKRFDRNGNDKLLTHTFAGIIHNDFNDPRSLDYKDLMDKTRELSGDQKQVDEVFRRCVFNVLTRNQDDHSKNTSFILKDGQWELTDAYDLNYSVGGWCSEHQLLIAGVSTDLKRSDLLRLAQLGGVNNPNQIIDEVVAVVDNSDKYFSESGMSEEFILKNDIKDKYHEVMVNIKSKSDMRDSVLIPSRVDFKSAKSVSISKCSLCGRYLRGKKRKAYGICSICSPKIV